MEYDNPLEPKMGVAKRQRPRRAPKDKLRSRSTLGLPACPLPLVLQQPPSARSSEIAQSSDPSLSICSSRHPSTQAPNSPAYL